MYVVHHFIKSIFLPTSDWKEVDLEIDIKQIHRLLHLAIQCQCNVVNATFWKLTDRVAELYMLCTYEYKFS